MSLTGGNSITGSSIDPDAGEFITPSTTLSGIYVVHYEICERTRPYNCSDTTISVTIIPPFIPSILANDDSGTFMNTLTGSIDLLANDIFSGNTANTIETLPSLTGSLSIPNVYIDGSGRFIVPPSGYTGGIYQFSYILCDILRSDNCDSANIAVTLTVPPVSIQT